jgi:tetratricopeptide (TPR) repeat protein
MQPFSANLKNTLAQDNWARVFRGLLSNPILWERLQEAEYGENALEKAGTHLQRWTPAYFALLEMGLEKQFDQLKNAEDEIDDELRFAGFAFLDGLNNSKDAWSDDGMELPNALLAAIGLKERYKLSQDSESFAKDLESIPIAQLQLVFSCLGSLFPNSQSFLELLSTLHEKNILAIGLRAFFSLPESIEEIQKQFSEIIRATNGNQAVQLLETLATFEPLIAKNLASSVEIKVTDNIASESASRLEGLRLEAQRQKIAGDTGKSLELLEAAWEASNEVQAELAQQISGTIDKYQRDDSGTELRKSFQIIEGVQAKSKLHKNRENEFANVQSLLKSAQSALDVEDLGSALDMTKQAFEELKQANSGQVSKQLYRKLGSLYGQLGENQKAIEVAAIIFRIFPGPNEALDLAKLHRRAGNADQALDYVHIAHGLDAQNLDIRKDLARVLADNGDAEKAFEIWQDCVGDFEDANENEIAAFAQAAIKSHHQEEAETAIQSLIARFPENPIGYQMEGQLLRVKSPDAAILAYERGLALDPSNETALLELANIHHRAGEIKTAINVLQQGSQHAIMASYFYALGKYLLEANQEEEAINALYRALNLAEEADVDQELSEITIFLGQTLVDFEKSDEAMTLLEKGHQRLTDDVQIAKELGRLNLANGNSREAIKVLEKVHGNLRDDPDLDFYLGRAYAHLPNELDQAEIILQSVLKSNPKHIECAIELAQVAIKKGNYAEANKRLLNLERKVKDIAPSLMAQFQLAKARLQQANGNVAEALKITEDLKADHPDNLQILSALCDMYRAGEREEEAFQIANQHFLTRPKTDNTLLWFAKQAGLSDHAQEGREALEQGIKQNVDTPKIREALTHSRWRSGNWQSQKAFMRDMNAELEFSSESLMRLSVFFDEQEAYQAALDCLKIAVTDETMDQAELFSEMAELYIKIGKPKKALTEFGKAITQAPQRSTYQIRKSELLEDSGDKGAALATIDDLLIKLPEDPTLLTRKAKLLVQSGNVHGALSSMSSAIAAQKVADDHLLRNAASLAMDTVQFEQAMHWMDQMEEKIEIDNLREIRGEIGLKQYSKAEEILIENEEDINNSPALLALRASIEFGKGKFQAGMASYRECLREYGKQASIENNFEEFLIAECCSQARDWTTSRKLFTSLESKQPDSALIKLGLAESLTAQAEWVQLCKKLDIRTHAPENKGNEAKQLAGITQLIKNASARAIGKESAIVLLGLKTRARLRLDPTNFTETLPDFFPGNAEEAAALEWSSMSNALLGKYQQRTVPFKEASKLLQIASLSNMKAYPKIAAGLAQGAAEYGVGQAELLALQAIASANNGAGEEAIELMNAALAIWPEEAGWHAQIAEWYTEIGDAINAAMHWIQARDIEQDNSNFHFQVALTYKDSGKGEMAFEELSIAAKLEPNNEAILMELAEMNFEQGKIKEAKRIVDRKINSENLLDRKYLISSKIALKNKKTNEALSQIQAAKKINPNSSKIMAQYAAVLVEAGQVHQAVRLLNSASKHVDRPLALLIRAAGIEARNEPTNIVISKLENLAKQFPNEAIAQRELAHLFANEGDFTAANTWADDAIARAQALSLIEQAKLHLFSAKVNRQLGNLDKSLRLLESALLISDDNADIYVEMGHVFRSRRQLHSAKSAFERAAELEPANPDPFLQLAKLSKNAKNYTDAEKWLRKAAKADPKNLEAHKQLAAITAVNLVNKASKVGIGS